MAKADKIQPLRPEDLEQPSIPDAVLESFNQLLEENWHVISRSATFNQEDVLTLLAEKGQTNRQEIFDKHWLDVEDLYQDVGWKVTCDRSGMDEDRPVIYKFRFQPKKG